MLGTYFVLILAMFIVMVVGAVLGYTGFYQIVGITNSLTYHHPYFLALRSHFAASINLSALGPCCCCDCLFKCSYIFTGRKH